MVIDLVGLSTIKLPVRLAALDGKYYGTEILDADGNVAITFWSAEGEPSHREKAEFGDGWTPEIWKDYCCDSHWECETDLALAEFVIEAINKAQIPDHKMVSGMRACNRFSINVTDKFAICKEN